MPTVTLSSKSRRKTGREPDKEELDQIHTSMKRFRITADAESELRRFAMEDLEFSIGTGQWDEAVRANREVDAKPCLTLNRINTFLRQYTGEERQNRPAMIVNPWGEGTSEELAAIHQGVLRHVEVASRADVVYDDAYDMMLRIGWAPWRITDDYIDEQSFEREPRIEPIENPFSAYLSPVRRPDGTDPLWAHVVDHLSKDEYKAEFGKDTLLSRLNFPRNAGDAEPGWVTKDGARIAEYWWLELKPRRLCLMSDGSARFKDELPKKLRKDQHIEAERDTVSRTVHCVKHDAMQVLRRYSYVGRYIPLVELNGLRLNVNGKIWQAGMVRDARDAQRIYDFMVTREVEQVDLYSKDPLWVPEGNKNHEDEYRQINRKNYSHQYYKAYDEEGRQLPPPMRLGRETPIAAMQALVQQADYDMKAVIGVYGTGPGERPAPNESAFAVLTRERQTETGTVNWSDNLNRAIVWQGTILLDLYPKLIDRARVQRIVNPDDTIRHVVLYNSAHTEQDDAEDKLDEEAALDKVYDVKAGRYDVVISAGPQYRTARQEAFRTIGAIVTAQPQLFPILGDIWIKYADWPGAHILADRLRKMLPPQLQDSDSKDPKERAAQMESQLTQMTTQYNQLLAELNRAADTIRTKRIETASRERVANMQAWVQLILQQLKSHDEGSLSHLQELLSVVTHRLVTLGEGLTPEEQAGPASTTTELPGQVEPRVQPITPAQPVPRPQPIPQGPQAGGIQ